MTTARIACAHCGEPFTQNTELQRFCSKSCREKYRRAHNGDMSALWPSHTFVCSNPKCGMLVITDAGTDKRTRFCSPECEREYWRHAYQKAEVHNQRFQSASHYKAWERRSEMRWDGEQDETRGRRIGGHL